MKDKNKRYKTIHAKNHKKFERKLNKLAFEGWRLHSFATEDGFDDDPVIAVLVNDNV